MLVALVCAGAAVVYGVLTSRALLALSPGNERMREISRAVQEGASAYLRRQYTTIAGVAVVPFTPDRVYDKLGWGTAFGFLIGGDALGRRRLHRHERLGALERRASPRPARGGVSRGARRSPSAAGVGDRAARRRARARSASPATTGCSPRDRRRQPDATAIHALVGLAFGGSLISVFARLGGGIFTKAADVGADLVGKIEAGIPEDDPRNPAVIADNVGDNVGDCAGMAADLFETYAVTAVAVMLLGTVGGSTSSPPLPLPARARRRLAIASVIGTFFARLGRGQNAMIDALYKAVIAATLLVGARLHPDHDGLRQGRLRLPRPLPLARSSGSS